MEIEVPSASNTSAKRRTRTQEESTSIGIHLFVKENSAHVRAQLEAESSVPQPEVMKACARLWREQPATRSKIITPTVFVNKSPLEL
jgi:hypothetical protein